MRLKQGKFEEIFAEPEEGEIEDVADVAEPVQEDLVDPGIEIEGEQGEIEQE